ncbi:protein of unknown function DUF389 containing protein [Nitzschia inconspicua]|uniref:DUF389 domain-containing protein n=1 Tax=Nitzschia inconspicua TaxID=303405 RepID=A0A9K3Q5V6_9STRA|nr:protein of unknown function DUF389 containing protein [Nitzschia inconspicua]
MVLPGGTSPAVPASTNSNNTLVPPSLRPTAAFGKMMMMQQQQQQQQEQQQQEKILATTTTKAYSVTIAVPKIHRCYVPLEEEEEVEEDEHVGHHHEQQRENFTDTASSSSAAVAATSTTVTADNNTNITTTTTMTTAPLSGMSSSESASSGNSELPKLPSDTVSLRSTPTTLSKGTENNPTTTSSSSSSHRNRSNRHRRAYTDGGGGGNNGSDGGLSPSRWNLVYDYKDDTFINRSSHPLKSMSNGNHNHDLITKNDNDQQQQRIVEMATTMRIEGVHETEGVVVQLEPKHKLPSSQNLAAVENVEDSIRNISSNRSRKLSHADRQEIMALMNGSSNSNNHVNQGMFYNSEEKKFNPMDDGTITPPPSSSHTDPNDATFFIPLEQDHELIGYVKGEESPKTMNKRGHRKTASNVPIIKDIVTAEEMAAIVKLPPAPPEQQQQQHQPKLVPSPSNLPPPAAATENPPLLPTFTTGWEADKTMTHPLTPNNIKNNNDHDPGMSTPVRKTVSDNGTIEGTVDQLSIDTTTDTIFGTTTPIKLAYAHDDDCCDHNNNNHHHHHGKVKRRVSYTTEAAAANALKMATRSSKAYGTHINNRNYSGTSIGSPTNHQSQHIPEEEKETEQEVVPPSLAPVGPPQPNTEIKVAVLVSLALKQLREDGHVLNRPRCLDAIANDSEWAEFTIVAKEPSIGIILERLERIGVGSSVGSVAIYKLELCRTADLYSALMENRENNTDPNATTPSTMRTANGTATTNGSGGTSDNPNAAATKMEWRNAASRLRVEQVKEQIHEQTELTFDYVSLLVVASLLAGIGLVVNSVVVIVASMLVSPLMGPVMGMTFGSRVLDWELTSFSLKNEMVSLVVCIVTGILVALCSAWTSSAQEWPTDEMAGRGTEVGLIAGVAIAIPSGMGVALSILGDNTSSLVGVAISASLLPPAVNAGICWMYAILLRTGAVENIADSNYAFGRTGTISLVLTIVNILCIWVAGILMFTIKEVAPSRSKSAFWEQDIKTARALKKGNKKIDMDVIKVGLQDAIEKEELAKQQRMMQRRMTLRRRHHPHRTSSRSSQMPRFNNFSVSSGPSLSEDIFEETLDDMLHPSPLFDDVHHSVSMTELATMLGFDRDADDFVEENDDADDYVEEQNDQVTDEETPPPGKQAAPNSNSDPAAAWYKIW